MSCCGLFSEKSWIVHRGITCDGCQMSPIRGNRWKCNNCPDYDLCQQCMTSKRNNVHGGQYADHVFSSIAVAYKADGSVFKENHLAPVPLDSLDVVGCVASTMCNLTLSQVFTNREPHEIEAVYYFPMDSRVALTGLKVLIDDRTIEAQLEEKQNARAKYDDAVAAGNGAYLMESLDTSKDMFQMSVGRLLPGKTCIVTMSLVAEMVWIDKHQCRLTIPMAIAPRYNNPLLGDVNFATTTSSVPESQSGSYRMTIDIEGCCHSAVSNVQVNVSELKTSWKTQNWRMVGSVIPNKDLVLDVKLVPDSEPWEMEIELEKVKPADKPGHWLYSAAMTLYPKDDSKQLVPGEYIFLIDCSGSMGLASEDYVAGEKSKIQLVKDAVGVFLRGMVPGCSFNICRFGSSYEFLFPEGSRTYCDETFAKADEYIRNTDANMGGTELLNVVTQLCTERPSSRIQKFNSKVVILLTDGEVGNTQEVIDVAKKRAGEIRFFTIGVGDQVSTALIDGMARHSGGTAEFIKDSRTISEIVVRQQKISMSAYYADCKIVEWLQENCTDFPEGVKAKGLNGEETVFPFVFPNKRNRIYCTMVASENFYPFAVRIGMPRSDGNIFINTTPVHVCRANLSKYFQSGSILALAARDTLEKLEANECTISASDLSEYKQKIVNVSLKGNVLSKYTAFVAVEKRNTASQGDMQLRRVPIQVTTTGHACDGLLQKSVGSTIALSCTSRGGVVPMCVNSGPNIGLASCNTRRAYRPAGAGANYKSLTMSVEENCFSDGTRGQRPETAQDRLLSLINLQKFDGRWGVDSQLLKALQEADMSSLETKIHKFLPNVRVDLCLQDVYVTAYVVMLLKTNYADSQSTWELVYQKALQYLKTQKFDDSQL